MGKKKWLLFIPLILVIAYLGGPRPAEPAYSKTMPSIPGEAAQLEQYIQVRESQHHLRPDNEARMVWANDSSRAITEYSIVYLHGFSASQEEGDPVHQDIARQFGCNLYLSRLAEHGIDTTESMVNLTADAYYESAKEALAIGKQTGRKVILMGTSTGGTLALKLAADFPDVHALVLLSPNIEINDPAAWVLNNPWGLQLARMITGSKYIESNKDTRDIYRKYWTWRYRIESVVALQELLETSMTKETFSKVQQPTLLLYYYKDAVHQDSVVKVSAMLDMFKQLGTPEDKKRAVAMPNAGDHVIGSYIKSKDVEGVKREVAAFLREVVKMDSPYFH